MIRCDLLAKGASKTAKAFRPDSEAHSRVDGPASEGGFFIEGGSHITIRETLVLDAEIPCADVHVEQHPHADEPMIKKTRQGEEVTGGQALGVGQHTVQEPTTDVGERATEQAQQTSQNTEFVEAQR